MRDLFPLDKTHFIPEWILFCISSTKMILQLVKVWVQSSIFIWTYWLNLFIDLLHACKTSIRTKNLVWNKLFLKNYWVKRGHKKVYCALHTYSRLLKNFHLMFFITNMKVIRHSNDDISQNCLWNRLARYYNVIIHFIVPWILMLIFSISSSLLGTKPYASGSREEENIVIFREVHTVLKMSI